MLWSKINASIKRKTSKRRSSEIEEASSRKSKSRGSFLKRLILFSKEEFPFSKARFFSQKRRFISKKMGLLRNHEPNPGFRKINSSRRVVTRHTQTQLCENHGQSVEVLIPTICLSQPRQHLSHAISALNEAQNSKRKFPILKRPLLYRDVSASVKLHICVA